MDPLSFSASLITILTLATKLGSKIIHIVEDTKDAPSELTEIRDEIISLMWVIERLDALSKEEQRANPMKPILWSGALDEEGTRTTDIEIALKSCTKVMKEMSRRLDTVEGYLTGGVFDKMKYPFFISSERSNLRDLRSRLAHSKTAILMSLQLRTLGLVKAASSASIEHHGAIRELLKLVQNLKLQNEQNEGHPISQAIGPGTHIGNRLTGTIAILDPGGYDETGLGYGRREREFDLEVYSSLDVWMAKFRKDSA
ncbi:hypothetical protein K469DRAFT_753798 [Zopfia rhizophila CBS 207.26]|uniref:Azaphilone pigments biosynthesis cluster protein L N-terminal domain-containing protein n=1 Tax=Zopfia rhizophila CBS 207.26 TaxID=1314779 RepID=A0A6A6DJP8_9PEZI|nr:hypothetical protein K469DRAFT_753798 [Zopfia rhizophila CBS 207.26]